MRGPPRPYRPRWIASARCEHSLTHRHRALWSQQPWASLAARLVWVGQLPTSPSGPIRRTGIVYSGAPSDFLEFDVRSRDFPYVHPGIGYGPELFGTRNRYPLRRRGDALMASATRCDSTCSWVSGIQMRSLGSHQHPMLDWQGRPSALTICRCVNAQLFAQNPRSPFSEGRKSRHVLHARGMSGAMVTPRSMGSSIPKSRSRISNASSPPGTSP